MSAMEAFWAAPPVTRTLVAATATLSLAAWGVGLPSIYQVVFVPSNIFTIRKLPEVWRLITPFLLTGPQFGLILDPYFLWTYGKALEVDSSRFSEPGSFLVFLVFVGLVIQLLAGFALGAMLFLQPLILSLAYIYAQENPNNRMSMFIVTFQTKYLPYAMLAMTLVTGGPIAALHQATGLLAAHLYDFLTRLWPQYGGGRKVITTPLFVRRWFEKPRSAGGTTRAYGTAFQSAGARGQGAQGQNVGSSGNTAPAGGWTSGFSGSWSGRGQGRRLGGD